MTKLPKFDELFEPDLGDEPAKLFINGQTTQFSCEKLSQFCPTLPVLGRSDLEVNGVGFCTIRKVFRVHREDGSSYLAVGLEPNAKNPVNAA